MLLFKFVLISLNAMNLIESVSLDETCKDQNNVSGTCTFLHECQNVVHLKMNGRGYVKCGDEDGKEIVCCARRDFTAPKSDNPFLNTRRYIQECEKYKRNMFDTTVYFRSLSFGSSLLQKTTSNCSQYENPLIAGGVDAKAKEFPHMALLGCKDTYGKFVWTCGGSLISPRYVLTAAHCFTGSACRKIEFVRLGELNLESESDDAQPQDYRVEANIPHPQYRNTLKYNDIGLVKLNRNVYTNFYIRPACLPYNDYNNESQLIITGWGSKEHAGPTVPHMQKAAVELFEQSICNDTYLEDDEDATNIFPSGVKYRTQICAGSHVEIKDTCPGDSGGPLQTVHTNYPCMFQIVGVTSYGLACGNSIGTPGVYTRVFNYINWIETIVWG